MKGFEIVSLDLTAFQVGPSKDERKVFDFKIFVTILKFFSSKKKIFFRF
jgi:hypothetical protein